MALPPTIPTSFVPPSSSGPRRFTSDYTGAFGFFGYGVFVLVIILSIGVFSYDKVLDAQLKAATDNIAQAEKRINSDTVHDYVELRNRLDSGRVLLQNHIALSDFTGVINMDLPTTVRFTSMHLAVTDTQKVTFDANGTAASFNALASLSKKIGELGHVKDAVFSNIAINKDSKAGPSVTFSVMGSVEPDYTKFKALPLQVATTTGPTATTTP